MAPSVCTFAVTLMLQIVIVYSSINNENIIVANEISKDTFDEKVNAGDLILVNFVGPGCKNCKEFAPIFNEVNTELLKERSEVEAVVLNNMEVVRRFDIRKIPSVFLFRKSIPIFYEGHNEVEELLEWIDNSKEVQSRFLNDDDFEHLTQASTGSTTGDWLVQFAVPERPQCEALIASWEAVAYRLKGKINVATVDISKNPALAKRFKVAVERTPYVVLLHQGKQFPYGLFHFGIVSLTHFAEKSYKHVQGTVVKPPPAPLFQTFHIITYKYWGYIGVTVSHIGTDSMKEGNMYKLHRKMINAPAIQLQNFFSVGYTESKVFKVPRERWFFDDLTESIANKLKEAQAQIPGLFVVIVGCLVVFSIVLCKIFCGSSSSRSIGSRVPKKGV